MKVTFVIGSLKNGGSESQLIKLIAGLRKRNFEPKLFAFDANGELLKTAKELQCDIIHGGYAPNSGTLKGIYTMLICFLRLLLHLIQSKPDVVHGFLPHANIMTVFCGKLLRIKSVMISYRSIQNDSFRASVLGLVDSFSRRFSDVVVCNSLAVRNSLVPVGQRVPSNFVVIYNGIDAKLLRKSLTKRNKVRRSLNIAAQNIVLIIVANLIPYKGHDLMLEATASLIKTNKNFKVLIVGEDRGILEELRTCATKLGINPYISWLGYRTDIPALLAASDIYVCCSHEEGFSNSILEAMALGLPIVATNVGGNIEMLESVDNSVLVPVNSYLAIEQAIIELVKKYKYRKEIHQRLAPPSINNFGLEKMINSYVSLYQNTNSRIN